MDHYYEDGYWREGYWGLFWETGAPEFYLLRGDEAAPAEGKAAAPFVPVGAAPARRP